MTSYDAGDVVLVHYPFTDLTTTKKRPSIVISPRVYSDRFGDVVVMPLTSQPDADPTLALSQWRAAGLLKSTWIKPIIGTLSTRLIERYLGKLAASDEACIRAALKTLLDNRWSKP